MRGVVLGLSVLLGLALAAPLSAAEDPEGKTLFRKTCGTCHSSEKGAAGRQGPNLFGVVGRAAGTKEGFAYSEAFLKGRAGIVWDRTTLDRWLEDPQAVIPGAIMLYKQKDPAVRARVIAYLDTLH